VCLHELDPLVRSGTRRKKLRWKAIQKATNFSNVAFSVLIYASLCLLVIKDNIMLRCKFCNWGRYLPEDKQYLQSVHNDFSDLIESKKGEADEKEHGNHRPGD